jgi:hypothetical protein
MSLIYASSDLGFAETAVRALTERGIPSYVTGRDSYSAYVVPVPRRYCVHIELETDRARATEILLQLGAAPEEPLPTGRWVRWLIVGIAVTLTVVILLLSK